jgi:hypothetical protein
VNCKLIFNNNKPKVISIASHVEAIFQPVLYLVNHCFSRNISNVKSVNISHY